MTPTVPITRLPHAQGLPLPAYETALAAGMDLRAAVPEGEPLTLRPGSRFPVPTGLAFALPPGFEGQVRPRSGLALRHGVTVLNSPGTIDCDYRGELQVLLVNLGDKSFVIERGERIAQLVVAPVHRAALVVTVKVDDSERGAGGFGSTGTSTIAGSRKRPAAKKAKLFQAKQPAAKLRARRMP